MRVDKVRTNKEKLLRKRKRKFSGWDEDFYFIF